MIKDSVVSNSIGQIKNYEENERYRISNCYWFMSFFSNIFSQIECDRPIEQFYLFYFSFALYLIGRNLEFWVWVIALNKLHCREQTKRRAKHDG